MTKNKQIIDKLVWIDLETTGFYSFKHKIIQIGVLITDTELNLLDDNGFMSYIGITEGDKKEMIEAAIEMHTQNGLLNICLATKMTVQEVETEAIKYVSQFVKKGESPLCGSNSSFDRRFLEYHMPTLNDYLHYRNIDVSTVKQLNNLWGKDKYTNPKGDHTALSDLKHSMNELKFYKSKLFNKRNLSL